MGVQDPPCDAAATETSGTRDHIPQGVLRVVVSEPVSARAAEQGSDRANFTLPGCYSRLFLVRKATGEWRPIIRSVLPQVFSCTARETSYIPPFRDIYLAYLRSFWQRQLRKSPMAFDLNMLVKFSPSSALCNTGKRQDGISW